MLVKTWYKPNKYLARTSWVPGPYFHQGWTGNPLPPLFLRLDRTVLISFWASCSVAPPFDPSLFLRWMVENKSTSPTNDPSDSLHPFRDTCCSKEGRSCPAPHGSELTEAQRTPCTPVFLLPSVQDCGASFGSPGKAAMVIIRVFPAERKRRRD